MLRLIPHAKNAQITRTIKRMKRMKQKTHSHWAINKSFSSLTDFCKQLSPKAKQIAQKGAENSFGIASQMTKLAATTGTRIIGTHIGGVPTPACLNQILPYPSPHPTQEQREQSRQFLTHLYDTASEIPIEHITQGISQKESLHIATQLLFGPHDTVLIQTPIYPTVKNQLEHIGCTIIEVDVIKYGTTAFLEMLSSNTSITGAYIENDNPLSLGGKHQADIADVLTQRNIKVILDGAYDHMTETPQLKQHNPLLNNLQKFGPSVFLHSFSKSLGIAGIRRGITVTNSPELTDLYELMINELKSAPDLPSTNLLHHLLNDQESVEKALYQTKRAAHFARLFFKELSFSTGFKTTFDLFERNRGPFVGVGIAPLCFQTQHTSQAIHEALMYAPGAIIGSQPNTSFHSNHPFLRFSAACFKTDNQTRQDAKDIGKLLSSPSDLVNIISKHCPHHTPSSNNIIQTQSPLFYAPKIPPSQIKEFASSIFTMGAGVVGRKMAGINYLMTGGNSKLVTNQIPNKHIWVDHTVTPLNILNDKSLADSILASKTPVTLEVCLQSGNPSYEKFKNLLTVLNTKLNPTDISEKLKIIVIQNGINPAKHIIKAFNDTAIPVPPIAHYILSAGIVDQDGETFTKFDVKNELIPITGTSSDFTDYENYLIQSGLQNVEMLSSDEGYQKQVEKRAKNTRNIVDAFRFIQDIITNNFTPLTTTTTYREGLLDPLSNQFADGLIKEFCNIYNVPEPNYQELQLNYAKTDHTSSTVTSLMAMITEGEKVPELAIFEETTSDAKEKGINTPLHNHFLRVMNLFIQQHQTSDLHTKNVLRNELIVAAETCEAHIHAITVSNDLESNVQNILGTQNYTHMIKA
ncbi:hypothetical protein DID76_02125 [Candidatus Marinamargulisbacteria bacterium SCGC AG-414-C22]|nr:hypothetical protein DID76_02125 [Candidatus Marinamargulisbacteria bacterium SCGC AG-414-C22]